MFRVRTAALILTALTGACELSDRTATLPPIGSADSIAIWTDTLCREVEVNDPAAVAAALEFVNGFQEGWISHWGTEPASQFEIRFYSGSEWVGSLGLSESSISRTVDDYRWQGVDSETIRAFAARMHLAMLESGVPRQEIQGFLDDQSRKQDQNDPGGCLLEYVGPDIDQEDSDLPEASGVLQFRRFAQPH